MDEPIADSKPYATFVFSHEGEQYVMRQDYERLREMLRWIPVTERLPPPGDGVLIFFRATDSDGTPSCIGCDGKGGLITVAAMDRINGQHLWTSEYGDETPTHWMPLPAPPADGK